MEDQKRGMEPLAKGNQALGKRSRSGSDFTIMIVRSVGKVQSFKVSPRFLLLAAIFLIIYIPASIYVINLFLDQRLAFNAQTLKIKQMEKAAFKNKKNMHKLKQHVALLKDYIHRPEEGRKQGGGAPPRAQSEKTAEKPTADISVVESLAEVGGAEEKSTEIVDIKDIRIRIENSEMKVDFKLVNVQPGDVVGGYVHTILLGSDLNPPPEWTYPREPVKNGVPLNFRRGYSFSILRFKPIEGKFDLSASSDPPSLIKVLVYDRSGLLILEREFEVGEVS